MAEFSCNFWIFHSDCDCYYGKPWFNVGRKVHMIHMGYDLFSLKTKLHEIVFIEPPIKCV